MSIRDSKVPTPISLLVFVTLVTCVLLLTHGLMGLTGSAIYLMIIGLLFVVILLVNRYYQGVIRSQLSPPLSTQAETKPTISRNNQLCFDTNDFERIVQEHHTSFLNNLPLGACVLDADKIILSWNKSLYQLSNIEAEEAIGSHVSNLSSPWARLLGDVFDNESLTLHKHRIEIGYRTRWFNFHKNPYQSFANPGHSGSKMILIEDLTDLQSLEIELAYSERLASIGRLAAGVAHEIGNPLTGIACLAQNLKHDTDDPDLKESTEQILEQTKRIAHIVESLVHFSQGGKHNHKKEENLPLKALIDEAVDLISLSYKGKRLIYENQCQDLICVKGDHQRLLQAFLNLFENARDASEPGDKIQITSVLHPNHVEITISDHGKGIPAQLLNRIFDPFFTTKGPGQGTGLGLPLVYRILKDHGGHIYISSHLNHGTQAIIKLPIILSHQPKTSSDSLVSLFDNQAADKHQANRISTL